MHGVVADESKIYPHINKIMAGKKKKKKNIYIYSCVFKSALTGPAEDVHHFSRLARGESRRLMDRLGH